MEKIVRIVTTTFWASLATIVPWFLTSIRGQAGGQLGTRATSVISVDRCNAPACYLIYTQATRLVLISLR